MGTKVLIVDDHEGFRSMVRSILEADGYDVVGVAGDGAAGIAAARDLEPELVVLDVQLPDTTGFEVARQLRSEGLTSPIILTSSRDASSYGDQIETSGAVGFIPKAEMSGEAVRGLLDPSGGRP
jgi:DNA-binding NarL/FixJ family response regulator